MWDGIRRDGQKAEGCLLAPIRYNYRYKETFGLLSKEGNSGERPIRDGRFIAVYLEEGHGSPSFCRVKKDFYGRSLQGGMGSVGRNRKNS